LVREVNLTSFLDIEADRDCGRSETRAAARLDFSANGVMTQ
jgi:hypothetical protein